MTPARLVALTLALSAPLSAQEAPNLDPAATGTPGGVAQAMLAQELYARGIAGGDALLALAAARLAHGVTLTEVAREAEPASAAEGAGPPDAAAMLAGARALAGEDEALQALADEIEATAPGTAGAGWSRGTVAPGAAQVWRVPFFGAALAEVAVAGGGTGNLDLSVADAAGAPVCTETGALDREYCAFVPAENGFFLLTVTNPGTAPAAYLLLTN